MVAKENSHFYTIFNGFMYLAIGNYHYVAERQKPRYCYDAKQTKIPKNNGVAVWQRVVVALLQR